MTDEGQRQLKVSDFSVEWYNLEHTPLIQLHFLTNRSPPLISQPTADSFPPGEAKNRNHNPPPFNAQLNFPTLRAAISRPYSGVCRTDSEW